MDKILLPDAPAIAGLNFRFVVGETDAEALYAVHARRSVHDAIDPLSSFEDFPTLEDLPLGLRQAVAEQRQDQWLVVQIEDRVIGYSQFENWHEDDGTWVYLTLGWLLPEWRGWGIGTAMLHWAEARIRHLASEQHPHEKVELAANASSTEIEATALLLREGYRAEYTVLEMGLDLEIPLPEFSLPEGIEVRPVLPEHYLDIAYSIEDAYRYEYDEGRFGETFDPVAYMDRLRQPKHDAMLWLVAWQDRQVVGQVLSLLKNDRAEVFEVSVRPPWRRQGVARSLLSRALHTLRARGATVIRLCTVAEFRTRARDLYHSVGFRVLKEFPRYRKPLN
ncbi:MAG: GNAT family N-acetyltransferase [Anaerolineae bacterium]|nr:GNAT family N-acetyltransferase [Anaerolineae bacterium]